LEINSQSRKNKANFMETEIPIDELREHVRRFISERNWDRYHTPKNLAMSIAIEAAELMENFQWLTDKQSFEILQEDDACAQVVDELADILIYCLSLANKIDINISAAILDKLSRNEERYPIGYMPTED
jgi:NTP pyrophosphatase (non-canonical NTP hydrolase)